MFNPATHKVGSVCLRPHPGDTHTAFHQQRAAGIIWIIGGHTEVTRARLPSDEWSLDDAVKSFTAQVACGGVDGFRTTASQEADGPVNMHAGAPATIGGRFAGTEIEGQGLFAQGWHRKGTVLNSIFAANKSRLISPSDDSFLSKYPPLASPVTLASSLPIYLHSEYSYYPLLIDTPIPVRYQVAYGFCR